jgi:hypothetical protein
MSNSQKSGGDNSLIDALKIEKQKTKVLKNALKEERKARD